MKKNNSNPVKRGQALWKMFQLYGLPFLWSINALLMFYDFFSVDPPDPGRDWLSALGHNQKEALIQGLLVTLIELLVVYAILRPRSFQQSWLLCFGALVVYLPWTVFSLFLAGHAGGVFFIHFFWLLSIDVILLLCSVWKQWNWLWVLAGWGVLATIFSWLYFPSASCAPDESGLVSYDCDDIGYFAALTYNMIIAFAGFSLILSIRFVYSLGQRSQSRLPAL